MPNEIEIAVQPRRATGTIKRLGEIQQTTTRFGERYRLPVFVEVNGQEMELSLWLTPRTVEQKKAHPNTNVAKLLTSLGITKLSELVGQKVNLAVDERGFYRIVP